MWNFNINSKFFVKALVSILWQSDKFVNSSHNTVDHLTWNYRAPYPLKSSFALYTMASKNYHLFDGHPCCTYNKARFTIKTLGHKSRTRQLPKWHRSNDVISHPLWRWQIITWRRYKEFRLGLIKYWGVFVKMVNNGDGNETRMLMCPGQCYVLGRLINWRNWTRRPCLLNRPAEAINNLF